MAYRAFPVAVVSMSLMGASGQRTVNIIPFGGPGQDVPEGLILGGIPVDLWWSVASAIGREGRRGGTDRGRIDKVTSGEGEADEDGELGGGSCTGCGHDWDGGSG